jgi:hypothetical protein
MLASYGLAGVLTCVCYRSATDHVTRKLTEEWCQYYPIECDCNATTSLRGILRCVCDADIAVKSAAFNQLVTSKGLHHFNGFGRSIDAPLSRHAHCSASLLWDAGNNYSNDNSKPHNVCVCVIYLISYVVCLTFRFVASFMIIESTSTSIE